MSAAPTARHVCDGASYPVVPGDFEQIEHRHGGTGEFVDEECFQFAFDEVGLPKPNCNTAHTTVDEESANPTHRRFK
jgi:hypothetical protein